MELHITCIPGDGIGPEIVRETKKVLDKVAHKYGHKMIYKDILMGGASIDVHGVPLTEESIAYAKAADAVLMGSIGGNTTTSPWYKLPPEKRPEAGLLALRKALNLFANLRPAVLYDELAAILKQIKAAHGNDKTTSDGAAIEQARKQLEDAQKFEGSPLEKKMNVLMGQIGIDYSKLTKEEQMTLLRVFNKSSMLKHRAKAGMRGKHRR